MSARTNAAGAAAVLEQLERPYPDPPSTGLRFRTTTAIDFARPMVLEEGTELELLEPTAEERREIARSATKDLPSIYVVARVLGRRRFVPLKRLQPLTPAAREYVDRFLASLPTRRPTR